MVTECEKAFSGTGGSGKTDGGTTDRVFGTFLTWLQEKKSAVFVVATANDVTSLPGPLLRRGRFDELFFVDLPNADERKEIWDIHLKIKKRDQLGINTSELAELSDGYTGAEIEQILIDGMTNAFYQGERELEERDIAMVLMSTSPLSRVMESEIKSMREWASGRVKPASAEKASFAGRGSAAAAKLLTAESHSKRIMG